MEQYYLNSHNCQLQVYSINPNHAKTVILFLHGGPGSGAKAIIGLPAFQLLSQNYHCLYFDQRGSGNSHFDLKTGISIEDITDDVLQVIEDAKERWDIQNLFLWGGSFGGYLASLFIERFPENLDGLILSSPAITFTREQGLQFYTHMQAQYQARINSDFATQQSPLSPEEFFAVPSVRDFIFSEQNPSNSLRHICAMSTWFFQHPFPNLLNNLSIPTLIMQGKQDPICHYQYLDEMISQANNHNIEYQLYDQCGHEVFTDQQDEFHQTIQKFIRRNL